MIAILQARLGSTRLPGKVLFTFFGQTIVQRVCAIAHSVAPVERVIVATGRRAENRILKGLVEAAGAEYFEGSEDDVLQRYIDCAQGYVGEYILRLTCDNYIAQPALIEGLYDAVAANNADYGFVAPLSHFAGEVIRAEVLRAYAGSPTSSEAKEHVTWDIRNDPQLKKVELDSDFMQVDHTDRITLDTLDDLILMKELEVENIELKPVRCLSTLMELQSERHRVAK